MILYKEQLNSNNDIKSVTVYLDGRAVGIIKPAKPSGWRYFPKGSSPGEIMPSVVAVKRSLESED